MTDAEASDIDGQLAIHGWRYHAPSETFLDADDNEVDWPDVLAALPDLSLNLLEAYKASKLRHLSGSS